MAALNSISEVQAVSKENALFTADLHNAMKPSNQGNLIYSPFSLSVVVAMAKMGAKGSTADEITAGFRFPPGNDTLASGYSKVLSSLQQETDGYILAAANCLYSQTGFQLNPEFNNTLKNSFHAEAKQLDFSRNVESAAEINSWVEKTTHDKIKNLISADALGPDTKVVLVNGIYFKGQWAKKFDSARTTKQPFYISETEEVMVDTMDLREKIPYGKIVELNATAVALPYKGDRLCMLFLVPNERTGLSKIENGLKDISVQSIFDKMKTSTKIHLQLPKFKLESTLKLVEVLQNLGIKSMFDPNTADFSGISSSPLYVSEVIQKAFIEVNEEGSEAAAATGMMIMARSMPMVFNVTVNVPFIFQIIDKETNFVLFSGACTNPSQS